MKQITVTGEPKQKITILFEDTVIIILLKFRPTAESWTADITFRDTPLVDGKKLTMGVALLRQFNKPFDIVLQENQNTGIDPYKQDDFISRVNIFLLERDDLIEIRGYDVI